MSRTPTEEDAGGSQAGGGCTCQRGRRTPSLEPSPVLTLIQFGDSGRAKSKDDKAGEWWKLEETQATCAAPEPPVLSVVTRPSAAGAEVPWQTPAGPGAAGGDSTVSAMSPTTRRVCERADPSRVALYGEPRRLSPNTEVAEEVTQGTSDETDEKARN